MINYEDLTFNIARVAEQELRSRLADLKLSHLVNSAKLTESKLDRTFEIFIHAALNPKFKSESNDDEITTLVNHKSKFLMPSLLVYSCGACSSTYDIDLTLKAAAAAEFLLCSLSLFDDIQDKDKPDFSLQGKFGSEVCLDVALIFIELAQGMFCEINEALFSQVLSASLILRSNTEYLLGFHTFCSQSLANIFSRITVAARGQLLDLQEKDILLEDRLGEYDYYLSKASFKSGLIVSSILEIGATLGLAQSLIGLNDLEEPSQLFSNLNRTLSVYKDFGFYFGTILQLISDLDNFLAGFPDNLSESRDLSHRELTLPIIYSYDSLSDSQEKQQFIEAWKLLDPTNSLESPNKVLIRLLDKQNILLPGVSQTIAVALKNSGLAYQLLQKVDPTLSKQENRIMMTSLKQLIMKVKLPFAIDTDSNSLSGSSLVEN